MPDRTHVHSGENALPLIPGFAGNLFATKLDSVFPVTGPTVEISVSSLKARWIVQPPGPE